VSTLVAVSRELSARVEKLEFRSVPFVYNPLVYAIEPHEAYLERWGQKAPRELVLLGMNPGPFGMAQTGVPFGDVAMVRDFLGVTGRVEKPLHEHPRRPIAGFACHRSEVSGTRFWGWARDRFGSAESFFDRVFVANWCPLVFMDESGRNRTPDKLPAAERRPSSRPATTRS
jgi:single-strand selective monofunctional uracil DNA glycosylase